MPLTRRFFLRGVGLLAVGAVSYRYFIATGAVMAGDNKSLPEYDQWQLTDQQWQEQLSPAAYNVLRKEGTERAGSSPLDHEKREGNFVCAGCELPLFASKFKYDSGTGWPSFYDAIEGHVATKKDYKLILPRTEYHCARCGGHQGHIFKDGPKPTGLRYCNNGVALKFILVVSS